MKLYDLVVEGNTQLAQGLMIGFVAGRNKNEHIYHGKDYHIKPMHLDESILDKLGLGKKYTHYVIVDSLVEPSIKLIETLTEEFGIEVVSVEEVKDLSFDLELKIYSKEIGEAVKKIIANRDEVIELTGYQPEEKIREDAKGQELYAPEHDYELTGTGSVGGPFQETLAFYYRLWEYDQVHLSELSLKIKD